jgi:hypothetical protein
MDPVSGTFSRLLPPPPIISVYWIGVVERFGHPPIIPEFLRNISTERTMGRRGDSAGITIRLLEDQVMNGIPHLDSPSSHRIFTENLNLFFFLRINMTSGAYRDALRLDY